MKKIALILAGIALLSLIIFAAVPALAHGPSDGETDDGTWNAMYEACENGDYQAMADAAEEYHETYDNHCFVEDAADDWDGHMGGMMGGGWSGMMH